MRKFMRWAACAMLLLVLPISYGQCEDLRLINGKVKTIDKTHSTIVIRWLADPSMPRYEEAAFTFNRSTKVFRGSRPASVDGLNVAETVTVKYRPGTTGLPEAVIIMTNT